MIAFMTRPLSTVACCLLIAASSAAQPIKFEKYDGPAILLPEGDPPPPPRRVDTKVSKQNYEDGTLRVERTVARFSDDSFVSEGPYREFYPTGKPFVFGAYSAGAATGEWVYYHPSGEVAKRVTFRSGRPQGKVELRRADGTLQAVREYAEGKRHGEWITYSEDGEQPRIQQNYDKGTPTGDWKVWYEDGKPRNQWSYKEGKRNGLAIDWYKNGEKRGEATYVDGKREGPAASWDDEGNKTERVFKDDKIVQ